MKNYFLTHLQGVSLSDNCFILSCPLIYVSEKFGQIVVPEGFVTDFASVPRIGLIYNFLGNRGNYAATVHDFLYSKHNMQRKSADLIFLEALEVEGIPLYYRYPMYWGVKVFGSLFWNVCCGYER